MKKTFLSILSIGLFTFANAQVEIHVSGAGADVAGTTVTVQLDGNTVFPYEAHLEVTNTGATNEQWRITRVKKQVPNGWTDQVCWPPSCFNASGDTYITPHSGGNPAPIIVAGTDQTTNAELAELKPTITPNLSSEGSATYMYYITDATTGVYVDSVALQFNYTLSIEDQILDDLTVSIAPNPATDIITIKTNNTSNSTIKMVDVLGNVVLNETSFNQTKKIDVSNFRNGIYFVKVESEGSKAITRKVVVRH